MLLTFMGEEEEEMYLQKKREFWNWDKSFFCDCALKSTNYFSIQRTKNR